MSLTAYSQFQALESSEKIGLMILEGARRLTDWEVHSGSIYKAEFSNSPVVAAIEENGVALTLAANIGAVTAGKYFYDKDDGLVYVRATDSASPDTHFTVCVFKLFFSNLPVNAPYDLASGFDVHWLPLLSVDSVFEFSVENSQQLLGVAVSAASSLKLKNDRSFWDDLYDTVTFESQNVSIYSWNRRLPIAQAKLLYKGQVTRKTYSDRDISFEVRDFLDALQSPVPLALLEDYFNDDKTPIIPNSLLNAFQRRVYGYVFGHVLVSIDQVLPATGYPLTGTFSVNNASTSVSGSGTLFLSELSPGDQIIIGTTATKYKVDDITSDTALTISEAFVPANQVAQVATVIPSHNKRYANRVFLVCGHPLPRPSAEITSVIDNATFTVDDSTVFTEGDAIEFSGSGSTIRVLGDGLIKLTEAFTVTPSITDIVYRSSVGSVYLDGNLLSLTRDYTYEEDPGAMVTTRSRVATLTLDPLAEFNIATPKNLTGTLSISNASRTVAGTSTIFRTELKIGDWISVSGSGRWYEILKITSDTSLVVRTLPSNTESGASQFKHPEVFGPSSVLTCDTAGKVNADGDWLRYPGTIADDLLRDVVDDDNMNSDSFEDADEILPFRIGLAIPDKFNDKNSPKIRDVLNKICRSSFAEIVLTNDYVLEMKSVEPSYGDVVPEEFNERDILKFEVASDSSQIILRSNVVYLSKERDPASGAASNLLFSVDNDQYLSQTTKEFKVDTYLVDEDDANIIASRWAFLLSASNSDVTFLTKMQAARIAVFDILQLNHEKLYLRLASDARTRIGVVTSIKKSIVGAEIVLNDLGNSFTRCARITEDDADDFDVADEDQLLLNGYMTDENGLTDGESGIDLIW